MKKYSYFIILNVALLIVIANVLFIDSASKHIQMTAVSAVAETNQPFKILEYSITNTPSGKKGEPIIVFMNYYINVKSGQTLTTYHYIDGVLAQNTGSTITFTSDKIGNYTESGSVVPNVDLDYSPIGHTLRVIISIDGNITEIKITFYTELEKKTMSITVLGSATGAFMLFYFWHRKKKSK